MTDDAESPIRLLLMASLPELHDALRTLFDLDTRLGGIVRSTREPLVGQMRLTWWREALIRLDAAEAPAEPLLRAIQLHLLPTGISGARLATMIDGWEGIVVAETIGDEVLDTYCRARGEGMFAIAASLTGGGVPALAAAGRAWAAADLAAGLSDPVAASAAVHVADTAWSTAFSTRWPVALRPVGTLSLIAMLDRRAGSPIVKALRVARFRMTGR